MAGQTPGVLGLGVEGAALRSAPIYSRSPSILWLFVAFAYACAIACTAHVAP